MSRAAGLVSSKYMRPNYRDTAQAAGLSWGPLVPLLQAILRPRTGSVTAPPSCRKSPPSGQPVGFVMGDPFGHRHSAEDVLPPTPRWALPVALGDRAPCKAPATRSRGSQGVRQTRTHPASQLAASFILMPETCLVPFGLGLAGPPLSTLQLSDLILARG